MPILRNPETGHRAICEDWDVGRLTALGFMPAEEVEAKEKAKAKAKAIAEAKSKAIADAKAKATAGDQKA